MISIKEIKNCIFHEINFAKMYSFILFSLTSFSSEKNQKLKKSYISLGSEKYSKFFIYFHKY